MDKRIEAIVIDVDGCLVPTNGDTSPEYYASLAWISQCIKQANQGAFPPIGFCSGRDRNYIESTAFYLGLPNSWSIIESGVALFNPTTKELLFNPALTPNVQRVFKEVTKERIPKFLKTFSGLFLYPGNMVCVTLELEYNATISVEEVYKAVKKEMADLLEKGLVRITHSNCAVDISPPGIDKASGIQFWARHTGLNLAKTLSIGDSKGDFPLFRQTGYVGCPENASKECKRFVKSRKEKGHISSHKYASGVVDIIKHFTPGVRFF